MFGNFHVAGPILNQPMPRGRGGGVLILAALETLTGGFKCRPGYATKILMLFAYPSEMFIYDLHIYQRPYTIFTQLNKCFELPVI